MTDADPQTANNKQEVLIAEQSDGTLCDTYHTKMCAVICKRLDHTRKPTVVKPMSEVAEKRKCKLCEDIGYK